MNFRGDFLINHADKIKNKIVLECAAGDGMVSSNIIELEPSTFYMTDYPNSPLFAFNKYKNEPNVIVKDIDILHDLPEFYKEHNVDTVICCRYLYHTCHPAWAIEKMLWKRPKYFYLETTAFMAGANEVLGIRGNHSSYPGAIPYQFSLPAHIIEEMISSLDYKLLEKFDRSGLPLDEIPEKDYDDYKFWTTLKGWWFERND